MDLSITGLTPNLAALAERLENGAAGLEGMLSSSSVAPDLRAAARCVKERIELYKHAKALVDQLKVVEASDQYKSVWAMYMIHGYEYRGPQYGTERDALRDALAAVEGAEVKP